MHVETRNMPMPKKPRCMCLNCGKELQRHRQTYCSNQCQVEFQFISYIERWKVGLESGLAHDTGVSRYVRRYMLERACCACEQCGWNKISESTGKCPLHIDHIDGNFRNCSECNLRVLCPNCHSLTPTYGACNSNGRHVVRETKRLKNLDLI